jgi:hypothetical protein
MRKHPSIRNPPCAVCNMGMIVTGGFKLDRERQTLECLRCGRVEKPSMPKNYPQAAE